MTMHICCLLAMLLANPPAAGTGRADLAESDLLISRHEVLADIDRVCAVLVTPETKSGQSSGSYEPLRAQVVEKLRVEGVEHIECQTGITPRLHVHIEVVPLAEHGVSVYRVQTALSRIVTFTDHRELKVQADVWRLRPVMQAVPDVNLSEALAHAVLTQVEVFAGACRTAHRLQPSAASAEGDPSAVHPDADPIGFVASRNSIVFHRPNCPSVARISERNRVTYTTRQEAVAAGKRPCKMCRP